LDQNFPGPLYFAFCGEIVPAEQETQLRTFDRYPTFTLLDSAFGIVIVGYFLKPTSHTSFSFENSFTIEDFSSSDGAHKRRHNRDNSTHKGFANRHHGRIQPAGQFASADHHG
jgi:hypothetical protein